VAAHLVATPGDCQNLFINPPSGETNDMNDAFRYFSSASSFDEEWLANANALADQLGDAEGPLGVLYVAERLTPHIADMLSVLRERSGVWDWVAAAGYGVITSDAEHFGETGSAVLVLDLPADGYRLFSGDSSAGAKLVANHADWITEATMPLAITHVDPRDQDAMMAVAGLADATGGFLIGGLTATSSVAPHQSGGADGTGGDCISGVALSPMAIEVATALSQGCSPLGKAHTVTRARDNFLLELDGRPALDVLIEEIGPELANDLQRIGGVIFAALPVAGSDMADYTVRNLVGIDPQNKVVAIAEAVPEGDPVLFCRRDRDSAIEDMRRMTSDLKRRVGNRPIRGGLYISCAARGPNQFAAPNRETDIIHGTLGEFPMAGFFANGEISRDRVYAYTGVLTLFL
jgi:small ligand-binding sensory domain FIST